MIKVFYSKNKKTMKKLLYILLVSICYTNTISISAQQTYGWGDGGGLNPEKEEKNHVVTRTYTSEDGTIYLDRFDYYDGLGRYIQTVQKQASPYKNDLVTYQEYDEYGRENKTWLPISYEKTIIPGGGIVGSQGTGEFVTLSTFKGKTGLSYPGENKPYSFIEYEASPLSRVVKQYGPGQDWQNNGKSVSFEYLSNTTNGELSCIYFSVTGSGVNTALKKNSNYAAGQLYVIKTTDEDGNISYEFKDKLGQIVLNKRLNNNPYGNSVHNTYYVYDDSGNLCYVLPPMAVSKATNFSDDNEVIKQYAYLYKYDARNRCVKKRIPGMEWISLVYDKADRLIFSQDGEQYTKGDWAFSIPDIFGRTVLTGICKKVKIGNNAESSISIGCLDNTVVKASWANATNTLKGYTTSGATPITPTIYGTNYYDGYTFLGKNNIPDNVDTRYNVESGYGAQYTQSAKGLLTGTLTAQQLSNGTVSSTYLYSVMYYDLKGQIVQTKSNNHLSGGIEKEYLAYDFTGQSTNRKTIHSATGKTTQTEVYGYSYDHAGRLKETSHKLNNGSSQRLISNNYDRLGKLELQKKGNVGHGITYTYNIRSWIKSISSPLFKQTLYYNEPLIMPNSTPSYSGNISAVEWAKGSEKTRRYNYFYDGLSQLLETYYFNEEYYENYNYIDYSTYYDYDLNGNVTLMSRWGPASDYLTLEYKGNQLIKADDGDPDVPLATSADFKDYSNATIEYAYNKNGAMTKDLNKGISDIQYNSLNLPRQMDIKSPVAEARNEYTYSTGGQKLKVVQKWNPNFSTTPIIGSGINVSSLSMTKTTDYVGNKVYENGSLKRILINGGYIENGTYYFYLTDHLGNNRMVINQSGQVIQKNDYYPFGMAFAEGTVTERGKQPYKFGNKELDQMHGLNQYDIEARYYDSAIGRFTTIDPMAEKYYSWSPYVYVTNNPIKYIDPDGREKLIGTGKRDEADEKVKSREHIDNDMIHIYAHGGVKGFKFIDENDNVTTVRNADDLKYLLNRYSAIWNNRVEGEELFIVLHACETGKIYEGIEEKTLVEKLSAEMPDVLFAAPDEDVYWNYGREYAADEQGNVANWVYYKAGSKEYSHSAGLEKGPDTQNHKRASHTKGNTKQEQQAQYNKGSDKSKNKPQGYEHWGDMRKWFFDTFGF